MIWILCVTGLLLLVGVLCCFIFWLTFRHAKAVKNAILSGNKTYLIFWEYGPYQIASVQKKGSSLSFYRKKLSQVREVYICQDGILIGDVIFYRWKREVEFKRIGIARGNPSCLEFVIDYGIGDSRAFTEFWIPIPTGREKEAETILDLLF